MFNPTSRLINIARRANDMAASVVQEALVTPAYTEGSAAGEPYRYFCMARANKIILYLHSWSGDYKQVNSFTELLNISRSYIISPNFNGPNRTPSALYTDDALARIATVLQEARVHTGLERVYLVGYSGGAIAGLNFMGAYPGIVHRASLWLPAFDLASVALTTIDPTIVSDMTAAIGHASTGPNDPDYLARSPRSRMVNMQGPTTIYLNAGVTDTTFPVAQARAARDFITANASECELRYKEWPIGHLYSPVERYETIKQLILE